MTSFSFFLLFFLFSYPFSFFLSGSENQMEYCKIVQGKRKANESKKANNK